MVGRTLLFALLFASLVWLMVGSLSLILVLLLFANRLLILLLSVLQLLVIFLGAGCIELPAIIIRHSLLANLDLSSFYITFEGGFFMELNVYTIFNRIDGSSDQLILARSDTRVATDFVNSVNSRNHELEAKHYPLISLNDYELRKIGKFEDTTSVLTPTTPVVVPFA